MNMKHLYLFINTFALANAFSSGVNPTLIASSSSSRHVGRIHQQPCTFAPVRAAGRTSCQTITRIHASASNDNNSESGKSIFEQAFGNLQMPWEDKTPNKSESSQQQQQWQWWPNSNSDSKQSQPSKGTEEETSATPRKQRKPRVPRYPSALQTNLRSSSQSASLNDGKVNSKNIKAGQVVEDETQNDVEKFVKLAEATVIEKQQAEQKEEQVVVAGEAESPTGDIISKSNTPNPKPRTSKLGILLIDHGSKRQKSNEFLMNIAKSYQSTWDDLIQQDEDGMESSVVPVVVEGAHMEIAPPSIYTQLHKLIVQEEVTTIICVPYFLSPGKHATVDVPNLIKEAIDTLDTEGLLDYYHISSINGDNEQVAKKVQILSAKSLGSNVKSMLGVVDVLVERSLKSNDNDELREAVLQLLASKDDEHMDKDTTTPKNEETSINADALKKMEEELLKYTNRATLLETTLESKVKEHAGALAKSEEELRKYTNRATLLETTLEEKVKELQTMTNRVTLMEDALTKMQGKMDKEQQESVVKSNEVEKQFTEKIANLTEALDAISEEKGQLESEVLSMISQREELEKEYNTTIINLKENISTLEGELQHLQNEQEMAQQLSSESSSVREEELHKRIEQQQNKILELQSQLADLLDAHNELEQLQQDTEDAVQKYKVQLNGAAEEYKSSLQVERDQKVTYEEKARDTQLKLDEVTENVSRLEQTLNQSVVEYQAQLDEEKDKAAEWKEKWQSLSDEIASKNNSTSAIAGASSDAPVSSTKTEAEWSSLQNELDELKAAKANATAKVHELEKELICQREERSSESSSSELKTKLEQQEQMQKYLQAQLSTYYETIETQSTEIEEYQQKIRDMEQTHEEAMLIATNSVDASQKREDSLLTNIEELEGELATAKKARDDTQRSLEEVQARLDSMQQDSEATEESNKSKQQDTSSPDELFLSKQNKELIMKIQQLECRIKDECEAKEQILADKTKLENEVSKLILVPRRVKKLISTTATAAEEEGEVEASKKGTKKRRRVLRPWTWFRKT